MSDFPKDKEITVYIDTVPNLIRSGLVQPAEDHIKNRFQEKLAQCIVRWGQLPSQLVEIKYYEPLSTQARSLYIDGYFAAAVALCGMAVEALCISVADERVPSGVFKNELLDPRNSARDKIEPLKGYFRIGRNASLLHQVLDMRNDYLHLHREATPEMALECICRLSLAVLCEYGLFPEGQGKVRYSTENDVEETAKKIGITL